jgi:putative transposase
MRRKSIRLDPVVYREVGRAFSITVGTAPRRDVFSDRVFARACIEELREVALRTSARIYAYCLMPDHVHLLVGVPAGSALSDVVGDWKSRCYTLWREARARKTFWQRSYYDHAIRADEDFRTAAEYVLNNPVRAGLVARFQDYELCGSFEFDL